jgi:xanthine dehydrogenase small subunit
MGNHFEFLLNGQPTQVTDVAPHTTLLEFVRSRGLTGSKEGCAEGECGACAVLLVAAGSHGTVYRAVNSCLVPLPAVAGQEVYTVESLAGSEPLCEVQRAMVEFGGSQCGYCTPGFVVSMFAEQYRPDRITRCNPADLGGNLCRCTGYRPIGDAFRSLGLAPDDAFRRRLNHPAPALASLQYDRSLERFSRPTSLSACLDLLAADSESRLVAGNTDLGIGVNLQDRRYSHLISVEAIRELRQFQNDDDAVEIGAALTLTEIDEHWHDAPPVFREWLPLFASPLIRNRATLGGNLATASPIGDSAPLLLALDAEVHIAGPDGFRIVGLESFFRSYRQTALGRGEILVSIRIPKPFPAYARFYKAAKRRVDDISTVSACFAMDREGDGVVRRARMAYGGVAAVPMRAFEAERVAEGSRSVGDSQFRTTESLARILKPIGDHRGSAAYRLALAQSLFEKFCFEWEGREAA